MVATNLGDVMLRNEAVSSGSRMELAHEDCPSPFLLEF
jgi:hypothetical protein